jgi:hypothetical protein
MAASAVSLVQSDDTGRGDVILEEIPHSYTQNTGDGRQSGQGGCGHASFDLRQIAGRQTDLFAQLDQGKSSFVTQGFETFAEVLHDFSYLD